MSSKKKKKKTQPPPPPPCLATLLGHFFVVSVSAREQRGLVRASPAAPRTAAVVASPHATAPSRPRARDVVAAGETKTSDRSSAARVRGRAARHAPLWTHRRVHRSEAEWDDTRVGGRRARASESLLITRVHFSPEEQILTRRVEDTAHARCPCRPVAQK